MSFDLGFASSCLRSASQPNNNTCTLLREGQASPSALFLRLVQEDAAVQSWLIFMVTFHVMCYGFELCDRRGYFAKHKQFRGHASSPTYAQMLPTVLRNQVLYLLPSMVMFFRVSGLMMKMTTPPQLPPKEMTIASMVVTVVRTGLLNVVCSSVLSAVVHEVLFYVGHRYVLHSRWGYTALNHGLHHASPTNSAISAMYMAPVDFVLEIVLPYLGALWLPVAAGVCCSRAMTVAVLPLGSVGGLYEHSGYNFLRGVAGLDTGLHAAHHARRDCSFADGVGAPSVLDPLLDTACDGGGPAAVMVRAMWLPHLFPSFPSSQCASLRGKVVGLIRKWGLVWKGAK